VETKFKPVLHIDKKSFYSTFTGVEDEFVTVNSSQRDCVLILALSDRNQLDTISKQIFLQDDNEEQSTEEDTSTAS